MCLGFHRRARACSEDQIKQIRRTILDACRSAAERQPGLFSLNVPTSCGKTLAGLAFALKHDATHGLRRVIYIAPSMSIREQNASVFRDALGVAANAPDVFEHDSLAEPPGDSATDETARAAARRAETWDAPVVVTTNVQFFESLFGNKPGQCRKLHNNARSVILLDECQTLPPGLVAPTCGMLKQPASDLGCTIVLCAAAQPAFNRDSLRPDERLDAAKIIPPEMDLFKDWKRVHVSCPKPTDAPLSWSVVVDQMLDGDSRRQTLCLVNIQKAARALFDELKSRNAPGPFHLSTAMCPNHRREKLAVIRRLLDLGAPCLVVSTQLIETGVDVDFRYLMREVAPFASIIQAAGRCNREGRINGDGGRVVVFRSADGTMPPDRCTMPGATRWPIIFSQEGKRHRLTTRQPFATTSDASITPARSTPRAFRICAGASSFATSPRHIGTSIMTANRNVAVTWRSHEAEIRSLLKELQVRPRNSLFRALAPFQVNLFPRQAISLKRLFHAEPNEVMIWDGAYDDEAGIREEMVDVFIA